MKKYIISLVLLLFFTFIIHVNMHAMQESQQAQEHVYYDVIKACETGDLQAISQLSDKINLNYGGKFNYTPLHAAASTEHFNIIKYLIEEKGAKIDLVDAHEKTPLFYAVENNYQNIVEYLLKNGANTEFQYNGETVLYYAAKKNKLDLVKELIRHKADIEAKDKYGATPLHLAVIHGHLDIIEYLLDNKYQVAFTESTDKNGYTPLYYATWKGYIDKKKYIDIMKCLLQKRANINHENIKNDLIWCTLNSTHRHMSKERKLEVVKFLLSKGANTENKKNEETPLCYAAKKNKLDFVKELIKHKADIEAKNKYGCTPLHLAVIHGHLDIIQCLLDNKYQVAFTESTDNNGYTPLYYATWRGYLDIMECLLQKGANINHKNINNDLIWCALNSTHRNMNKKKKLEVVKFLLSKGVNTENKKNEETPLCYAARKNKLDLVKELVKHKANIESKNKYRATPLHLASLNGHFDIVQYLLDENEHQVVALVEATCNKGYTPLCSATNKRYIDIMKYLLQKGATINHKDIKNDLIWCALKSTYRHMNKEKKLKIIKLLLSKGANTENKKNEETPLCYAAKKNKLDFVKELIKHKADIEAKNKYGCTPLHLAVIHGHLDIIQCLLDNKYQVAFTESTDNNGYTPLYYATWRGYLDIMECLLQKGANINHKNINNDLIWCALNSTHRNMSKEKKVETVRFLLEHGALPNRSANLRQSVLYSHTEITKLLLLYGAKINKRALKISTTPEIKKILTFTPAFCEKNKIIKLLEIMFKKLKEQQKAKKSKNFQDFDFYQTITIIKTLEWIQNNTITVEYLKAIKCLCKRAKIAVIANAIQIFKTKTKYKENIAPISKAGFTNFLKYLIKIKKSRNLAKQAKNLILGSENKNIFKNFYQLFRCLNNHLAQHTYYDQDIKVRNKFVSHEDPFEDDPRYRNNGLLELRFSEKSIIIPKVFAI